MLVKLFLFLYYNSLHRAAFDDLVERQLTIRQEKLIKFNSLSIQVSPEVAHLFHNSKMVSSTIWNFLVIAITSKVQSHLLLNRDKNFKLMAKAEEEKAEKQAISNQIYQLKREVENLKDKTQNPTNEYWRWRKKSVFCLW